MEDTPNNEHLSYRHQHTLATLEFHIQTLNQDFTDVESKAEQYTNISAIVVALIAAFAFGQTTLSVLEKIILLMLVSSAGWAIGFTMVVLHQRGWKSIIDPKEENTTFIQIEEAAKYAPNSEYFKTMFDTRRDVIRNNYQVIKQKKHYAEKAKWGLYVMLGCSAILILAQVF